MSNARDLQTAARKRATYPDFVPTFSVHALQDRVPLSFPVPRRCLSPPSIATVPHIVTSATTTSSTRPGLLI